MAGGKIVLDLLKQAGSLAKTGKLGGLVKGLAKSASKMSATAINGSIFTQTAKVNPRLRGVLEHFPNLDLPKLTRAEVQAMRNVPQSIKKGLRGFKVKGAKVHALPDRMIVDRTFRDGRFVRNIYDSSGRTLKKIVEVKDGEIVSTLPTQNPGTVNRAIKILSKQDELIRFHDGHMLEESRSVIRDVFGRKATVKQAKELSAKVTKAGYRPTIWPMELTETSRMHTYKDGKIIKAFTDSKYTPLAGQSELPQARHVQSIYDIQSGKVAYFNVVNGKVDKTPFLTERADDFLADLYKS